MSDRRGERRKGERSREEVLLLIEVEVRWGNLRRAISWRAVRLEKWLVNDIYKVISLAIYGTVSLTVIDYH